MEELKDYEGITVKIGDKVKGEGFLTFQGDFKIDLSPVVTVTEQDGELMFGQLSAKSFRNFWIVKSK